MAIKIERNNWRTKVSTFSLAAISTLTAPVCFARDVAPDVLLKAATVDVIAIIRQDKDIQAGDPAKAAVLVESRIQPFFDFPHLTQTVAARNWRLATPEQQSALTAEFRTLLVRTYSTAISDNRDQVIEFRPLRAESGDTEVTVRSVIKQRDAAPLTVDYHMEKLAGGWQVCDITVDGISMISTYRETFAGKVRDGGMEGLIKSLAETNHHIESRLRLRQKANFYVTAFVQSILQSGR
jgi:phospholipid transport system substrate-binding protein